MDARVEVLRFPGVAERRSGGSLAADEFTIESAWGATVEPVSEQSDFAPGAPLSGVIGRSGEWWCVARARDGRRVILADRFGMQPLAISSATTLDGESLFVGTSAAKTAHAVRAAGGTLSTDWAYVLETIGARHDFLDCIFDFTTPTSGVRWLPPDRAIEVSADGFRIVPRPEEPGSGDYDSLLRAGIDQAIADVQHMVDTHERVTINLSGGKDSRVVLALVLGAGCEDRVQVTATDPTPPGGSIAHSPTVQQDLEISSRLVQGLGLKWVDWRSPRDLWPTTLEGELARFQNYRHGLTNQFVPLGLTYKLTEPEARINGAGGEIYRGYWAGVLESHPAWKQLAHTEASADSDARALLRGLRSPLAIPGELAERGEQKFVEAIRYLPGSTLAQSLDRHYETFRMRGHAGGRRWGQSYGVTNYSILQQSTLMRASQALDPAERYEGKVLYDIVENLAPELHDLEYQSGPWPWTGQRPPARDWSSIAPRLEDYRMAQKRSRQAMRPNGYKGRPRPDMAPAIATGLAALSEQMREDGLEPALIGSIRAAPPEDLRGQGRLLARLFNWASGYGDQRMLPLAMPEGPPRVRSFVGN